MGKWINGFGISNLFSIATSDDQRDKMLWVLAQCHDRNCEHLEELLSDVDELVEQGKTDEEITLSEGSDPYTASAIRISRKRRRNEELT